MSLLRTLPSRPLLRTLPSRVALAATLPTALGCAGVGPTEIAMIAAAATAAVIGTGVVATTAGALALKHTKWGRHFVKMAHDYLSPQSASTPQKKQSLNTQSSSKILFINRDEDCPPLSQIVRLANGTVISISMVADGMGGSGRYLRQTPDGDKSGAYIASRVVRAALQKLINKEPAVFLHPTSAVKHHLETALRQHLVGLTTQFPKCQPRIGGASQIDFPTTFSSAICIQTPTETIIKLFFGGDSPLLVMTPTQSLTNCDEDQIHGTVKGCITNKNENIKVSLESRELRFPAGTPVAVFALSDGVVKIEGGIQAAAAALSQALEQTASLEEALQYFDKFFLPFKNKGHDDSTIAGNLINATAGVTFSPVITDLR